VVRAVIVSPIWLSKCVRWRAATVYLFGSAARKGRWSSGRGDTARRGNGESL